VSSTARKLWILWPLYFVQGLPFGFQATALPVYLREAGLSLTAIGFATWQSRNVASGDIPSFQVLAICGGAACVAIGMGMGAIRLGRKHFDQIEV